MKKLLLLSFLVLNSLAVEAQSLLDKANQDRLAGKYEIAIAEYTAVIKQTPNLAVAYIERGYCFAKLKKYQEALNDYEQGIALGTSDPLAYLNRGWARYNLGYKQEACKDWQQALQMGYTKAAEVIAAHCPR